MGDEIGNDAPPTSRRTRVLLAWLGSKVVPLIGITVPNDSVQLGQTKAPNIVYNPPNASNKTYALESSDSSVVDIEDGKLKGSEILPAHMTLTVGTLDLNVKFDGELRLD